ncbi:MAG: DUF1573 domain-containing protein [Tenuifilaceae bacterium]|nr:DUF1573 domain-containing protein [Tenuifilaceae bacterium]
MKRVFLTFLSIVLSVGLFAQESNDEDIKKTNPFIRFSPTEVNLGSISVDSVTEETGNISIEAHNDGSLPLIINQVTGCCGTRITDWTREPIMPGQKGTIKIFFRISPTPQRISRTITVQSNAGNGKIQRLAILGEVILPKAGNEIKLP